MAGGASQAGGDVTERRSCAVRVCDASMCNWPWWSLVHRFLDAKNILSYSCENVRSVEGESKPCQTWHFAKR